MDTNKIRTLIAIGVVIGLTIFFHTIGWLRPIEKFFRSLVNRGTEITYNWRAGTEEEGEMFSSVEELQDAYTALKARERDLLAYETEATLLRAENEELRARLNFVTSTGSGHVSAEVRADVIGKNIEPLGSTLIINRGIEAGIAVGQPAIVGNGIFIGKIVRAETGFSVIELVTDSQSKVAASVVGRMESLGLVEGGYGISVRMSWIPQQETLEVGTMVVTSGLENHIPRGLLIGTIETIDRDPHQAFQEAVIAPIIRFDKVRLVTIITN